MSNVPAQLRYTQDHEWVRTEADGSVVIGITDHAQHQLGELVYVELPAAGASFAAGAALAVVESTKAASDVYAPVAGVVLAVNAELNSAPEKVNDEPYGAGWLVRLKPDDAAAVAALMDSGAYSRLTADAG